MAQSGFTPIQLYRSDTASAVPLAVNLADGELALNYEDGILFYKDASGVVQTLTSASAAGTVTSVSGSGGSTGLTLTGGPITTSGTLTLGGTLALANGGTGSGTASGARTNLGLGSLATLNSVNNSNWSGTDLAVENGGTGASSFTSTRLLKGNGTSAVSESVLGDDGTNVSVVGTGTFTTGGVGDAQAGSLSNVSVGVGDNDTGLYRPNFNVLGIVTGGSLAATFLANGNLGIGDANPLAKLHVNSGGSDVAALFESEDNGGFIEIRDDGSSAGGVLIGADDDNFVVRTAGSERLRLSDAGNLVITQNIQAQGIFTVGTGVGGSADVTTNTIKANAGSAWMKIAGGTGNAKIAIGNDDIIVQGGSGSGAIAFHTGATSSSAGTERASIEQNGTFLYDGLEVGWRSLNFSSTSGTTATSAIAGRAYLSTGNITVNGLVFSAGDVFTVVNNSTSNITLVQGSSMTMCLAGTTTTGNRTIGPRGIATVVFTSSTACFVSGNVS